VQPGRAPCRSRTWFSETGAFLIKVPLLGASEERLSAGDSFRSVPERLPEAREIRQANSAPVRGLPRGGAIRTTRSVVISMRLPTEIGNRLKRMANWHGWTTSDASARLVEEGLRRAEFAFIDFRDSAAGRQAYIQGSTLAVWEVLLLVQSYRADVSAVAKHLKWPEAKIQAAINYAKAFPEEIERALAENAATDFEVLKRMLPQATEFVSKRTPKR
jgi:uncharacterized protein (DUF433 family)